MIQSVRFLILNVLEIPDFQLDFQANYWKTSKTKSSDLFSVKHPLPIKSNQVARAFQVTVQRYSLNQMSEDFPVSFVF